MFRKLSKAKSRQHHWKATTCSTCFELLNHENNAWCFRRTDLSSNTTARENAARKISLKHHILTCNEPRRQHRCMLTTSGTHASHLVASHRECATRRVGENIFRIISLHGCHKAPLRTQLDQNDFLRVPDYDYLRAVTQKWARDCTPQINRLYYSTSM